MALGSTFLQNQSGYLKLVLWLLKNVAKDMLPSEMYMSRLPVN